MRRDRGPGSCSASAARPPTRTGRWNAGASSSPGCAGAPTVNACDLTIMEAAALLQRSDLFVGSDSGPMNLAAAVGTPAFGLFGPTQVLTYSRFIHAIQADDDGAPTPDSLLRIVPDAVLARIEPYLCAESAVVMNKPG